MMQLRHDGMTPMGFSVCRVLAFLGDAAGHEDTAVIAQRRALEAEEAIPGTPGTNYARVGACAHPAASGDQRRRRGSRSW